MSISQQAIEEKPNNAAYELRNRNSTIFSRQRRAINELLQSPGKRQRQIPTKQKPRVKKFKCNECIYATHSNSRLKAHGQVHNKGEKPFECDICKERFGYRHSLKKHSLRRHNLILL